VRAEVWDKASGSGGLLSRSLCVYRFRTVMGESNSIGTGLVVLCAQGKGMWGWKIGEKRNV